jgi:hypothetical protein
VVKVAEKSKKGNRDFNFSQGFLTYVYIKLYIIYYIIYNNIYNKIYNYILFIFLL